MDTINKIADLFLAKTDPSIIEPILASLKAQKGVERRSNNPLSVEIIDSSSQLTTMRMPLRDATSGYATIFSLQEYRALFIHAISRLVASLQPGVIPVDVALFATYGGLKKDVIGVRIQAASWPEHSVMVAEANALTHQTSVKEIKQHTETTFNYT